jgi:predicted metal-binding protein
MKRARRRADLERFVERARRLGAADAKIVNTASVATAAWVRLKCQFGCGGYNSSHCCPPHSPTPEQTRKVLDEYTKAILIHCGADLRPTRMVVDLEREIFLSGFYKALGFGAGPCRLCRTCHPDECIHRDRARPSMEASGIDVFATARANGFPIDVVKDPSCEQNYYGIVLID